MKALSTLKSAINHGYLFALMTLVIAMPLVFPELALASSLQTDGQSALVFQIKNSSVLNSQNQSLTYNQLTAEDPLVQNLKAYLTKYNSPLSDYADTIVTLPNWQKALSISWVESNFGIHCYTNNCSGIGVAPGHPSWRTYPTKLDWFKDLSALLEKPIYKEKFDSCKKMNGVYNHPGSNNWRIGCEQKFAELMDLTQQSDQQRLAMVYGTSQLALANNDNSEVR